MRLIVPIAALLLAALSVALDLHPVPANSPLCRYGACRFDQMYAAIDAAGATPEAVEALVNADPSNPMVWCAYAETLAGRGDTRKAEASFDRALLLGPSMPPVLMRYANYDFTHDRLSHALPLAARILDSTPAFDEILFSYLQRSGATIPELLAAAIPDSARPARAWLDWLGSSGSAQDLIETWTWMQPRGLLDGPSADRVAWALCNRGAYRDAYRLWSGWAGVQTALADPRFEKAPGGGPFDWKLEPSPAVSIDRSDGLEIRFAGTENVAFSGVRQVTCVPPGRYRFSAEIAAEGLTTGQRPFFRLIDPADPRRLDAKTAAIAGSTPRSTVSVDFTVPESTQTLQLQLERRPSELFDNRVAGSLHLYRVSLDPLPAAR